MASDVKWIKITTDVFDDEKILLIESLPEADSIIVIWFKLLCLAGKQNNSGVFMMGNSIPYTDKMLATIFRRKESTVQLALQTFEQFGMVQLIDGVITIPNWGKHQNLDQLEQKKQYMKNYMREYREKQKALTCKDLCKSNNKVNVNEADKDIDKDKEIDIDKDKRIDYQQVADMFNETCVSFPKIQSLSEARKKAIKARLNAYSIEDFKTCFEKAESSDFLKGSNDRNWTATFDWLIKDANMAKVLDGNYDNRKTNAKPVVRKNQFNSIPQREYDMSAMERMLLNKQSPPPTAGDSPEIQAKVEALKERLGV